MVFADDAAKVNRVLDKMNLDFVKSDAGEAVVEQAQVREAERVIDAKFTEKTEAKEELPDVYKRQGLCNRSGTASYGAGGHVWYGKRVCLSLIHI